MTRSETKLSTAIPAPVSGYQQWMLWRQRKMFDVTLTKMATFWKKKQANLLQWTTIICPFLANVERGNMFC